MKHELKIWPEHYWRVKQGSKTFEIRKNDRFFQRGDRVILRLWLPWSDGYSTAANAPNLDFEIGDVYPIDAERVVFSLIVSPDEVKNE
jgi:hypothetical protein